jgi:TonB family protein
MNMLEQNRPKGKTLAWVGGAHLLVLLIAFLIPALFKAKPKEKFIEMIPLGELDPGQGRPDSPDKDSGGSASSAPAPLSPSTAINKPPQADPVPIPPVTPPPSAPQPTLAPTAAPTSLPQKTTVPKKPEVSAKPPEKLKPAPTPLTQTKSSAKPKVVPNLTSVVKKSSSNVASAGAADSLSKTPGKNSGLSASEIESRLKGTLAKGSGNAGVEGGTGQGRLGDPNGQADAPWYDTYIGHQLKKNWQRPAATGPSTETWVSVRILRDGTVQYLRITKASGNPAMDQSVIEAVQSVKKLETPPPANLSFPYDRIVKFEL